MPILYVMIYNILISPRKPKDETTMRIEITGMTYGANAVGRASDGKVVFVPGAAPGDVVEVEITRETKAFREGTITAFHEKSPARVDAPCPFAGICGGCPWMHLSYEAQLEAKRASVVSQLSRIGGVAKERAEELVGECVGSKRQLGYRNKLELAAGRDERGLFMLGFHERGGTLSAAPKTCLLAAKGIEKAPGALRGALSYLQGHDDLGIFRVGVRRSVRTKDIEVALWTNPSGFPRKAAADTISSALKCTSIVRVIADAGKARKVKKVEALYGKGHWSEELAGNTYRISAPSFFQVNTAQAEKMIQLVIDGLEVGPDSVVADLYCGAGTFTLPLAQRADYVFAVESAASSVRDLRRNMEGIDGEIEVIGGDSARELPTLGHLDALVVDPPRAGLAKGVAESIAASRAQRVAYVSCDPATWARDIARFANVGYRLVKATPVDLFPQTFHVETVSILERL